MQHFPHLPVCGGTGFHLLNFYLSWTMPGTKLWPRPTWLNLLIWHPRCCAFPRIGKVWLQSSWPRSNVSHGLDPPYLIFGPWVISHWKGGTLEILPISNARAQLQPPPPLYHTIFTRLLVLQDVSTIPMKSSPSSSTAKNSVCQASKCFCVPYTSHKMKHWFRKLKWNDWRMRKNTECGGGDNSPHLISTKHWGVRTLWQGRSTPYT